ncbi:cyclic nucleotide-binding protein [Fulvitalea axinellae]|uniref:Cyclic nucleotide-binding protein n=1 Tax=Fulvitalea axinellae TaxID=1182444 RepID=A0AAU9D4D8_9BACT|nr:cyclic nucleotide-binding protein [Fulvitalea axinellae]
MDRLLADIKARTPIPEDLEADIRSLFRKEEIKKNDVLLTEGRTCRKLYYLDTGIIRTYYYHDDKEITSWFYKEGFFVTSWYSFLTLEPSFEYIKATEDSILYSIDHKHYVNLQEKHPAFERFCRILSEEQVAFIDYYGKGYMFLSAKERYVRLLEYFPDIELRVKLGDIATHLGISQETLSRIRSSS